jgi:hypothetical protein
MAVATSSVDANTNTSKWLLSTTSSGLHKFRDSSTGRFVLVLAINPQKLALTSPTGGGRSVGIVRSRTKAMEFSFSLLAINPQAYFQNIL